MTVQHGYFPAPATDAPDGLTRQADFRPQPDPVAARAADILHGAPLNLGFAAAGDAVEKECFESALAHGCFHGCPHPELIGIQLDGSCRQVPIFRQSGEGVEPALDTPCQSFFDESVDGPRAAA